LGGKDAGPPPTNLMASGDAAHILGVSREIVVRPTAAECGGRMVRAFYAAVLALKGQWQEEAVNGDEDSDP